LLPAAAVGGGWFLFAALFAWLEIRAATHYGVAQQASVDNLVPADLVRSPKACGYVVGLRVARHVPSTAVRWRRDRTAGLSMLATLPRPTRRAFFVVLVCRAGERGSLRDLRFAA